MHLRNKALCYLLSIPLHFIGGIISGFTMLGDLPWYFSIISFSFFLALIFSNTPFVVVWIGSLQYGLGFYGVTLHGLLGPLNGAFGLLWLSVIIVLSLLFSLFFITVHFFEIRRFTSLKLLFPAFFYAFEVAVFLLTSLIDENGASYLNHGYILCHNNLLLQATDFIAPSAMTVLLASISLCLHQTFLSIFLRLRSPLRPAAQYACLLIVVILTCSYKLIIFSHQKIGYAVLNENYPSLSIESDLRTVLKLKDEEMICDSKLPTYLVFPEAKFSVHLEPNTNRPIIYGNFDALKISADLNLTIIFGAILYQPGGEYSNSAIVVHPNGQIRKSDKKKLVAGLERKTLTLSFLQQIGLLPDISSLPSNNPGDSTLCNCAPFEDNIFTCVCYDIFFSDIFLGKIFNSHSVIACCLDESLDDETDAFKKLSMLHSRIRAVEHRCPLLRCAHHGNSAVIDAAGAMAPVLYASGDVKLYPVFYSDKNHLSKRFIFIVDCVLSILFFLIYYYIISSTESKNA